MIWRIAASNIVLYTILALVIESSEVRLCGSLPRIAMYRIHLKNQHALLLRISRTIYLNF